MKRHALPVAWNGHRVFWGEWEGEKRGWWYLKDLKILGYLFATNVKKTRVPEELIEGALWR